MITAMSTGVAIVVAMLLSGAILAIATPWARRVALVDRPSGHKTHAAPVPTIGGPAIVIASAVALALAGVPRVAAWPALAFGVALLLAVGIWDDRRPLSPALRFAAQIVSALVMIHGGAIVLADFGELLWPGRVAVLGLLAVPVTVFCAVGVMNALNMIDGMDGLAGSVVVVTLLGLAALAHASGHEAETTLALVAAGATLAFVAFNLRVARVPARVYLGNGGSLALGLVLAWLLVGLSQGERRAFAPVTALWLLALPLFDTVSVMWRRIAARRSPFAADRQHVHHLLQRAGLGVSATLAALLAIHGACVALGIAMARWRVPDVVVAALFVAVALVAHAVAARAAQRLPSWPAATA